MQNMGVPTNVGSATGVSTGLNGPLSLSSGFSKVKMAELDFTDAPTVKGIGFRFIIPVPNLGAESKTIEVKDWEGKPQTVVGYKFKNATDDADQAVDGDGSGVIIIGMNPEKVDFKVASQRLREKVFGLGGVEKLNVAKLNILLDYAHNVLGLKDTYNSKDKIADTLTPQVGLVGGCLRPFGLYEKAEKSGPVAVFVDGRAEVVDGPHAGFAKYPDGFLAVRIPPKKEGGAPSYRSIAPGALGYCYAMEDGSKISDPRSQFPVILV